MKYLVRCTVSNYTENEYEADSPKEAREKAIENFREILDEGLEDNGFETEIYNEETEKWE